MAGLSVVETTVPASETSLDPGESSPARASHSDGVFDLLIGARTPAGVLFGGLELMDSPQLPHAQVIYVPFDLRTVDASGSSTGIVANMLRVEIPDGEPYVFADVQLIPPDVDQFGLHFELRNDGSGGVLGASSGSSTPVLSNEVNRAPGQPLFNISLESDWVPDADLSTAVGTRPTNGSLVLSAFPNVMSSHTLLRLNRPMTSGTRIHIYDLAGRGVRSLSLSGGGDSAMWDGRDDRGDRVASGIYLARAEDAAGHAVRRLVVIR